MRACWDQRPDKRPSAREAARVLLEKEKALSEPAARTPPVRFRDVGMPFLDWMYRKYEIWNGPSSAPRVGVPEGDIGHKVGVWCFSPGLTMNDFFFDRASTHT